MPKMKRIVIFDFNRTLFDPEEGRLIVGAKKVLKELIKKDFTLYLISRNEERRSLIEKLGLNSYFEEIILKESKEMEDFDNLITEEVDRLSSFVVGDRVEEEIRLGNMLDLKTVWFKNGKFAQRGPERCLEKPSFEIKRLSQLLEIIEL